MKIVKVTEAAPYIRAYLRQTKHPHPNGVTHFCQFGNWYVFAKSEEAINFFVFSHRYSQRHSIATACIVLLCIFGILLGSWFQNLYIFATILVITLAYIIYHLSMCKKYSPKEQELFTSGELITVSKDDVEDFEYED